MQEYRSGHNEAVLKTVWVKAHGGSNPSSCAKEIGADGFRSYFFMYTEKEEGFEGGSRFAGAKCFALRSLNTDIFDGKVGN